MAKFDFRIGNVFDYHGTFVYVLEIKRDGIEFGYYEDSVGFFIKFDDTDFPKMVPITDDLLNSAGFMIYDTIAIIEKYKFYIFKPDESSNEPYLIKSFIHDIQFQYMHEIQNIFAIINKKELINFNLK